MQFRNNTAMPFEIVGVAYGGNGCDFRTDAFIISAFIKVTTYLDWIHDNTIDACKCL